jgi:hypothetical protein
MLTLPTKGSIVRVVPLCSVHYFGSAHIYILQRSVDPLYQKIRMNFSKVKRILLHLEVLKVLLYLRIKI